MTTRIHEAVLIRNHLVSLIQTDGKWQSVGGIPELVWRRHRFVGRLASPFNLLGESGSNAVASSAPNRLVLMDTYKTLFSVEWLDDGPIRILIFERGAWEQKFLALPLEA